MKLNCYRLWPSKWSGNSPVRGFAAEAQMRMWTCFQGAAPLEFGQASLSESRDEDAQVGAEVESFGDLGRGSVHLRLAGIPTLLMQDEGSG